MVTKSQLMLLKKERLAEILEQRAVYDKELAASLSIAVASKNESPSLAQQLRQRISNLLNNSDYYDWRRAPEMSVVLQELQTNIAEDLAEKDLNAAIEVMTFFVEHVGEIYNIVDDSHAYVSPVIADLVRTLGNLYAKSEKRNVPAICEQLFLWIVSDEYAVFDRVIPAFADALGPDGWNELEQLFRAQIAIINQTPGDDNSRELFHFVSSLLDIADLKGDVDSYIAISTEFGWNYDRQLLAIAERLAEVGRFEETLAWLDKMKPDSYEGYSSSRLRVRALEALGMSEELIALRRNLVLQHLNKDAFQELLDSSNEPDALREELLNEIDTEKNPYGVLEFYINVGELRRAAHLVLQKRTFWNGGRYSTLQPVADALEISWPLAASILYRALIDDVLSRAQSRYYHHAVRYLKRLEKLVPAVDEWQEIEPHERYLAELSEKHKRKSAFWGKYNN